MKSVRVSIKAAEEISKKYRRDQVIILSWDKETGTTWITTYGNNKEQCKQA